MVSGSPLPVPRASQRLRCNMPLYNPSIQILDPNQRVFHTQNVIPLTTVFLPVSSVLYCSYLGKLQHTTTLARIKFWVSTAGAGAQTAEIGFLTSPAAPNGTGQTLTCVAAEVNANISSLTTTGLKQNTNAITTPIAAGSHVWVGIRTAMATTQPTISGSFGGDFNSGALLTRSGSAALAVNSTYVMSLITAAISTSAQCPRLLVTMD